MNLSEKFTNAFVDALAKRSATAVVGLVIALAAAATGLSFLAPLYVWLPVLVAATALIVLTVRSLFRRLFVIYPRRPGLYEVVSKTYTYKIDLENGRRTVICRRRYHLRFLRSGLDTIREQWLWTGSNAAPPVVISGSCTVSQPYNVTIWSVVDLKFPREINRGEEVEFELEWRFDDTDCASRPFFSAPTNEPTRRVQFDLFLPESLGVREALVEERRSIDSTSAFSSEVVKVVDGHARWEKEDPGRFFYFCMSWSYP